jgi:hypothetical protein
MDITRLAAGCLVDFRIVLFCVGMLISSDSVAMREFVPYSAYDAVVVGTYMGTEPIDSSKSEASIKQADIGIFRVEKTYKGKLDRKIRVYIPIEEVSEAALIERAETIKAERRKLVILEAETFKKIRILENDEDVRRDLVAARKKLQNEIEGSRKEHWRILEQLHDLRNRVPLIEGKQYLLFLNLINSNDEFEIVNNTQDRILPLPESAEKESKVKQYFKFLGN